MYRYTSTDVMNKDALLITSKARFRIKQNLLIIKILTFGHTIIDIIHMSIGYLNKPLITPYTYALCKRN